MSSYIIDLPESAFSALRKPPIEFIQEMKYAAVVKWYEAGMITQDKAAEIAAISRYQFLRLLAQYKVSIMQYTPEILEEELVYVRGEGRPERLTAYSVV